MSIRLDYVNLITPTEILHRSTLIVGDDGKINYVGSMEMAPNVQGRRLDLRNLFVAPGFINIHVHGGNGITFGNPDTLAEDLRSYSKWVVKNGVTGFLTTITAPTPDELVAMIQAFVAEFQKGLPGAQALGIHLEGPFMNLEKKGAQNPDWIRNPSIDEAKKYVEVGVGWIKQMTMAPELPNAEEVARLYRGAGVTLAIGHSNADYEIAVKALGSHWTHITHTYNAQTGLHHRRPGVVGAVMGSDEITAELIVDLIHVHPGAIKAMLRCVGSDRIVLVTDAMEAAGLPDGEYHLLGAKVIVAGGKATQEDGTIAGSSAVMNQCVRNMHHEVGVSLADAVKMATLNPARVIGEVSARGSLQAGKQADLIVIDDDLNVYMTIVNGEVVYSRF
jgi:N-acetylglucosamine-6-phosphate deacetylase